MKRILLRSWDLPCVNQTGHGRPSTSVISHVFFFLTLTITKKESSWVTIISHPSITFEANFHSSIKLVDTNQKQEHDIVRVIREHDIVTVNKEHQPCFFFFFYFYRHQEKKLMSDNHLSSIYNISPKISWN